MIVISKVAQIIASEWQMTEKEKGDWAGQTRELSRVHSHSGKATNLVLFFQLTAISPSLSTIWLTRKDYRKFYDERDELSWTKKGDS